MSDDQVPRTPRAFSVPGEQPAESETAKRTASRKTRPANSATRKPRAVAAAKVKLVEPEEDFFEAEAREEVPVAIPPTHRKRGLIGWILALLGIVVSIALGLWFESIITTMFDRSSWLGWATLGVVGLLVLLVIAAIIREIAAIWKLRSIKHLREQAESALETHDSPALRKSAGALAAHFAADPRTAAGRATLAAQHGEIIDGSDLYALAETSLLTGLDAQARDLVMGAARRVSVVTAVSPRAFVDIGYVLYENIRLIRTMSEHYGGRTGTLGTMTLARRVIIHLAVTGTIAVGDSVIQQLLGQGMASRLSARFGEGVVNGLMTVRVGLAAMEVCRPAPFNALPRPKVRQFLNVLTKFDTENASAPNHDG